MSRLDYIKDIKLKEISLERIYDSVLRRLSDISHHIAWNMPSKYQKSNKEKLIALKDKHKGERCFIIANGPSLKSMNLTLLKNEYTIGMNRIYLLEEKMGFLPNYLMVIDIKIQLNQFYKDLAQVDTVKIFNWNSRKLFKGLSVINDLLFIKQKFSPEFTKNFYEGIWGGHSVTFACIQLAYYLGFSEVVLIGKDHDYKEKGVPGKLVASNGKESNHFVNGYYKKGDLWRIPDYKGEELAYRLAREAYEEDNRKIYDATMNGKLNVFEKRDFNAFFNK